MVARVSFYTLIIAFAGLLIMGDISFAAKSGAEGGGGGNTPPDYGDIYVLYRGTDGIPVLTDEDCLQPILSQQYIIDNPEALDTCLKTDFSVTGEDPECLAEVDLVTCVPLPEYGLYLQEVDFGRISLVRSPDEVFQAQLEEVIFNLTTAGCLSLDPAGRIVYSSLIDGVVVSHTVDSPLQNLAIYRKLMQEGQLDDSIDLGDSWMPMAAVALGAASDKEGEVTVDLVAYLNMIFGFTEDSALSALDKTCISVKQEVKGKIEDVDKCYLDYGTYTYNRDDKFNSLPSPAYIPSGDPKDGTFEYMRVTDTDPYTTELTAGEILDVIPELETTWDGSDIKAFTKAADDTRAVINFMHSFEVAEEYATPLTCESGPLDSYDVSISEESGLQVPRRMVAGNEGREGVVTIANSGPAAASGIVLLTGVDTDGTIVDLYLMVDGEVTDTKIFSKEGEPFDELAAGFSHSWVFYFSMDYPTTINWTAKVIADNDVNDDKNEVTAETKVTETKGGGGH